MNRRIIGVRIQYGMHTARVSVARDGLHGSIVGLAVGTSIGSRGRDFEHLRYGATAARLRTCSDGDPTSNAVLCCITKAISNTLK